MSSAVSTPPTYSLIVSLPNCRSLTANKKLRIASSTGPSITPSTPSSSFSTTPSDGALGSSSYTTSLSKIQTNVLLYHTSISWTFLYDSITTIFTIPIYISIVSYIYTTTIYDHETPTTTRIQYQKTNINQQQ